MLDYEENRRLDEITDEVWRNDPRFAAAFGRGKPCSPREYRRRRRLVAVVAALPALALLLLGQPVLAGMVAWAAGMLAACCSQDLLDRPGKQDKRRWL